MIFSNGTFRKSCFWNTLSRHGSVHISLFVFLSSEWHSSMPKIVSLHVYRIGTVKFFEVFLLFTQATLSIPPFMKTSFVQPHTQVCIHSKGSWFAGLWLRMLRYCYWHLDFSVSCIRLKTSTINLKTLFKIKILFFKNCYLVS